MTMRYNYLGITSYIEIVCLTVKSGCVWRPLDSSYRIQWRKIPCTVTKICNVCWREMCLQEWNEKFSVLSRKHKRYNVRVYEENGQITRLNSETP